MIQQLKFSHPSQYCNLFYVSCMHLGHDRDFIYKPRGFSNVEEHDKVLAERWNERVSNRDIVFSIGDTIFGENADVRLQEYFEKLNFWKLYLSPGNHFSGWRQIYKRIMNERFGPFGDKQIEAYPLEYKINDNKTVIFMPNQYEKYVGRQAVFLNHYPVFPHHGAGKGVWGIFGHCHGNNPRTHKDTGTGKVIDVCVESFGGPVSYKEIEELFKARANEDVGHHGPDTRYAI
jgi:calcineurin-like phosphoesterase family protein